MSFRLFIAVAVLMIWFPCLADGFVVKVRVADELTEREKALLEEADFPFIRDTEEEKNYKTVKLDNRDGSATYAAQEAVNGFTDGSKGIVFDCSKNVLVTPDFDGMPTLSQLASTFVVLRELLKDLRVGTGKKKMIGGVPIVEAQTKDGAVVYLGFSDKERKVRIQVKEGVWRIASLIASESGKMRRVFRKTSTIEGSLTPAPVLITPVSTAAQNKDGSAEFWNAESPHTILLTFSADAWRSLLRTIKEEYVEADFEWQETKVKRVGVRFKGNSSLSMGIREGKFPFKIDFDRFVDQDFLGMKKLNLSNNFKDPTMMREYLAYELFRKSGLCASRATFVKLFVTVKGQFEKRYFGLYTAVEQVDGVFLRNRFGNSEGTLFKPEAFGDDALKYRSEDHRAYANCELKYGELHPDYDALIRFTKLIDQSSQEEFGKKIGDCLDVEQFLKFIAMNGLLANYDSYIGTGHNFYLYYDAPNAKFLFIPWDMNEVFGRFTPQGYDFNTCAYVSVLKPIAMGKRLLVEKIMKVENWSKMYQEYLAHLYFCTLEEKTLIKRIEQIARIVEPAVKEEGENKLEEFHKGVAQLMWFIEQRSAFVLFELLFGKPPISVSSNSTIISDDYGSIVYENGLISFYDSNGKLESSLTLPLPPEPQFRLSKKYLIILAMDKVIRIDRKNHSVTVIRLPIPSSLPIPQPSQPPFPR